MLLARILSLHSLNMLSLLAYCYLGSIQPESTSLDVAFLSVLSLGAFFMTSLLIMYINRKVISRAIPGSLKIITLVSAALIATLLTKTTIFFIPLIFALTSLSTDLRSLLKYYLLWSIPLFLSLIMLQSLGIIYGGEVLQDGVLASSLGFGNPNGAFTYLFSILITSYVLLENSRRKIIFTTIALTSIAIIYSQTLSRTGLLCCLLVVFFAHANKMLPWSRIKRILPALFVLLTLVSVFLAIYHGQMGDTINDLLSNRPYWWNLRVEDGALSNWIGNADSFAKGYAWWLDSAPLDSFFLRIWFSNGLFILIIFFIFFRLWSKNLHNHMLISGTFVALLYGFSEYGILSNPGKNIILLLLMVPIFSKYMIDQQIKFSTGNTHAQQA